VIRAKKIKEEVKNREGNKLKKLLPYTNLLLRDFRSVLGIKNFS